MHAIAQPLPLLRPLQGQSAPIRRARYDAALKHRVAALTHIDETGLLADGLTGTREQLHQLVRYLTPVIQARVARALLSGTRGVARRNIREEVEDLTQDVYGALFDRDAKVLRAWDPERGLSLLNFVGLVARRRANATLATKKRNPWSEEPMESGTVERILPQVAQADRALEAKQILQIAFTDVAATQSERGKRMLVLMFQNQLSNEEIQLETALSIDAIYQWRSRLTKQLRTRITALMNEGATDAHPPS